MKRLFIGAAVLVLIVLGLVYLFVPSVVVQTQSTRIQANGAAFSRLALAQQNWVNWWPQKPSAPTGANTVVLPLHNYQYTLTEIQQSTVVFSVAQQQRVARVAVHFLKVSPDSVQLVAEAQMPTSYNPFKRVQRYWAARQLAGQLDEIMQAMAAYFKRNENVYGLAVQKTFVTDSLLIATTVALKDYPTTAAIYNAVDKLKTYCAAHNARITGYPMLNITTPDSLNYSMKVALPVDRKLPSTGAIQYRWMLGGGRILATTVKGGPARIKHPTTQLAYYVQDNGYVAPAIAFESLLTDRRQVTDTNQWVTKIFWPVM